MKSNKKNVYLILFVVILLIVFGVSFAFFNYTRTGSLNMVRTGNLVFNSEQGTSINLTNVFPVDVSQGISNNNPNVGSVTINVSGDTTYTEGIEYLVTAVNVVNT